MKQMDRRDFIRTGVLGMAGLSILRPGLAEINHGLQQNATVDMVKFGNTGLTVSRIAMGTGTKATNGKDSGQTRGGMDNFLKLAHHAYDRGIRFYDTAEAYGSMPFVGEAIKTLPRENLTILTKMWTQPRPNSAPVTSITESLDRYRKELNSDYIDVLLMHCLLSGDWPTTCARYMDLFSKAKQDGILKKIGVSCHHIDALKEASVNPWVDVIMARVNPFGTNMDGTAEEVKAILATAKANGKGIIGMKIFGEGVHVADDEREQSFRFAIKEEVVHCMTLGCETIAQLDDAIDRVMKIAS